jgi:hypothetical protein
VTRREGLFPQPATPVFALSRRYAGEEYQLRRRTKATWTAIKAAKAAPCDECFALQHESGGTSGPRSPAKHSRTVPGGSRLKLCGAHAELWRTRDLEAAA